MYGDAWVTFYLDIASFIDGWMLNLFYERVCPSVINNMSYGEMKQWNQYHLDIEAAKKKAMDKAVNKKGNK